MDKLTLQDLSAYLPYDIQFISEMDKPYDEYGNQPIWTISGITEMFGGHCIITKENNDAYDISKCKLILLPLFQLAQEIEHKGERFVPIEEIAKIECPNITGAVDKIHSITSFKRGLSFNSSQMGVTYRYEGVTVEITHFKDDIFHKRVINGNDSWVFSYFHNYPAIIQKLHEWHFDTANLLGRGLAVEIKEVTNE